MRTEHYCARQVLVLAEQTVDRTIHDEIVRLDGRVRLSCEQRNAILTLVRRVADRVLLDPISNWRGDPLLLEELFGCQVTPTGDRRVAHLGTYSHQPKD